MPPGSESSDPYRVPVAVLELTVGLGAVVALSALLIAVRDLPQTLIPAAALVYAAMAAILGWYWTSIRQSFGAANRVTLVRAALVAVVAGTALLTQPLQGNALPIAVLSTLALVLDGVDGWVARRTGSASAFGARFDMELDAFFILVLCAMLVQLGKAGLWVLAIGAMRYLFVIAMHFVPWLSSPLPESFRRKLVCVVQVAALLLCLLPVVTPPLATGILSLALAALTLSFALDVRWLFLYAAGQPARPHRNQGVRS